MYKERVQGTGSKKQGSGFREKGEAVYRGGAAKEILSWEAKISQGWHYEKE